MDDIISVNVVATSWGVTMEESDDSYPYEFLTRDIIEFVRSSGSEGRAVADLLDSNSSYDAPPLLGAINTLYDLRLAAPPQCECRLRALNEDGAFDEELEKLVESQGRLRRLF